MQGTMSSNFKYHSCTELKNTDKRYQAKTTTKDKKNTMNIKKHQQKKVVQIDKPIDNLYDYQNKYKPHINAF